MDAESAAREKLLKSKKTLRYVAELAGRLGLRGELQVLNGNRHHADVALAPFPAWEEFCAEHKDNPELRGARGRIPEGREKQRELEERYFPKDMLQKYSRS